MRVLLVDDEISSGCALARNLNEDLYPTEWISSVRMAYRSISDNLYDTMIVDPGRDKAGIYEFLQWLRKKNNTLPIIILCSNISAKRRIELLNLGADDCLMKPFVYGELLARIEAVHRRYHGRTYNEIVRGDLRIDLNAHLVTFQENVLKLSAIEYAILRILLSNMEHIFSREDLEQRIYTKSEFVESNAIEVHISHLRRKLGKGVISTIRGMGYVIHHLNDGTCPPTNIAPHQSACQQYPDF